MNYDKASSILGEAKRLYHDDRDANHDKIQALLREFVLCINPEHVFKGNDLMFPEIFYTDTISPSSFIHYIPDMNRSFHISIDGESIHHRGEGLYERAPYGCYRKVTLDEWRKRFCRRSIAARTKKVSDPSPKE